MVPGLAPTATPAGAVGTMERPAEASAPDRASNRVTGNPNPNPNPNAPTEQPVDARPPRRTPAEALRLFVHTLPVIVLAVIAVGGSVIAIDRSLGPATLGESRGGAGVSGVTGDDGDDTLPRYSAPPPTYGTATFHLLEHDGVDGRFTFNADASQVWFEVFPFSADTPDSTILANSGALFSRNPTDGWILVDGKNSSELAPVLTPMRLMTFGRYVPDVLRPYVTVEAHASTVLSGRPVDEYALNYDIAAMRASEPAAAHGLGFAGGGTFAHLVLTVDQQGVVWKAVLTDDVGDTVSWSLEYLGPEPFVVQFPTTYFNTTTGQQVTG